MRERSSCACHLSVETERRGRNGRYRQGRYSGSSTPGTCTFAGWESLQTGIRWGVPGVGVKDADTGKYLENQQTDPDIRVMNQYDVVSKGRDQQLEAAVKALRELTGGNP